MATWDSALEATPAGSDAPSTLDNKIREVKSEVRAREDHEHDWLNTTTVTGGWHKAGSAKVYFTTAAPTNRPDGSVALDSSDKGRLWYKSSTGSGVMVHNGTLFVSTGVTLSTAQTINGAKTFRGNITLSSSILTARTRLLRTTATTHTGLAALVSASIPSSNSSLVVNGVLLRIFSTGGTTITDQRDFYSRMFRSTSGVKYLQGSTKSILYNPTASVGWTAQGTSLLGNVTATVNTKISTGAVQVGVNNVKLFMLAW